MIIGSQPAVRAPPSYQPSTNHRPPPPKLPHCAIPWSTHLPPPPNCQPRPFPRAHPPPRSILRLPPRSHLPSTHASCSFQMSSSRCSTDVSCLFIWSRSSRSSSSYRSSSACSGATPRTPGAGGGAGGRGGWMVNKRKERGGGEIHRSTEDPQRWGQEGCPGSPSPPLPTSVESGSGFGV